MYTAIIVIHVIICVALICIVLLQTGKGASLGAAFGGATQTVFGATGGTGFFEKLTTAVAIIFMVTSLSLTYISSKKGGETIMKPKAAQEEKAAQNVPTAPMPDKGQKKSSKPAPISPSPAQGTGSK